MSVKWKAAASCGVVFLVALTLYLYWFMSPYEQCVRAEASIASEEQIKIRDRQEIFLPGEYKSDSEIKSEQRRLAILSCAYASD